MSLADPLDLIRQAADNAEPPPNPGPLVPPLEGDELARLVAALGCIKCGEPTENRSGTGHPVCARCMGGEVGELGEILDAVCAWLERFIIFPTEHGATALTLWVSVTHAIDGFDVAPYLLITAPEIESGKTRVMEVTAPLCRAPLFSSSMTPAVLFRTIDKERPTLFLDEADNIWTGRQDDKASELVALLNAGHRRGMKARRMGGAGKTTLQEFEVFGPKAIAGAFPDMGAIPEALRSRSVHLRMKRKLPGESVARWTRQERETTAEYVEALRTELSEALEAADPASVEVPLIEDLGDRDFDIWEPLIAIGTRAGQEWRQRAIDAAIALCAPDPTQAVPLRILMLRDLRDIWEDSDEHGHMLTSEILECLHRLGDRPWGDFYGTPLSAHKLAGFLRPYGIESKFEPGEKRRKGYFRQDLEDLWARYAPGTSQTSQTSQEPPSESIESIESLFGEDTHDVA